MNELIPAEYQNQRILTTSQLAESYGTDEKRISENFSRNIERYIVGKHYFFLSGEQLKEFKQAYPQIAVNLKFAPLLHLWTEKGAWLHAKSLNTDKAWEAYETLVDDYYAVKQLVKPQSIEDLIILQAQSVKDLKTQVAQQAKEITENKEAVQSIRDVVSLNTADWRNDTAKLITRAANKLGGNEHIRDLRKESYKLLDKRMAVSLEIRLTNKRRRMADEGVCKSKRDALNHLDVIAEDKKLVEGYVAIVKDMAIKYGV